MYFVKAHQLLFGGENFCHRLSDKAARDYEEVEELPGYLNTGGLEGTGHETRRPSSVMSLLLTTVLLDRKMRNAG